MAESEFPCEQGGTLRTELGAGHPYNPIYL